MFHTNKKKIHLCVHIIILGLICGELAFSETPHLPTNINDLEALDETKLANLDLSDPLLKSAYLQMFLRRYGVTAPWQDAVRKDLLRRGDAATPLLLQLFAENNGDQFRSELLRDIDQLPTINLTPFLQTARNLFKSDGLLIPARTCYAMARLFERHGDAHDLEILNELRNHPDKEVTLILKPAIIRMEHRLQSEHIKENPNATSEKSDVTEQMTKSDSAKLHAPMPTGEPLTTPQSNGKLLLLTSLAVVAVSYLFWFLMRSKTMKSKGK